MFSDVLRKLRKEKGLSQSALADILNMSQQAIGKWETNHATPDFDTLVQLADYFNDNFGDWRKCYLRFGH